MLEPSSAVANRIAMALQSFEMQTKASRIAMASQSFEMQTKLCFYDIIAIDGMRSSSRKADGVVALLMRGVGALCLGAFAEMHAQRPPPPYEP